MASVPMFSPADQEIERPAVGQHVAGAIGIADRAGVRGLHVRRLVRAGIDHVPRRGVCLRDGAAIRTIFTGCCLNSWTESGSSHLRRLC